MFYFVWFTVWIAQILDNVVSHTALFFDIGSDTSQKIFDEISILAMQPKIW